MNENQISFDPRVRRLPGGNSNEIITTSDQLSSFEVFIQAKEGKPFQHEGAVRASDREYAFILAKEAFSRRFTCVDLFVVATNDVIVSEFTDGPDNIYDKIVVPEVLLDEPELFEVFEMPKRGKQPQHVGRVEARGPFNAMKEAKSCRKVQTKACNLWAIRVRDIRFTTAEEKKLWDTLSDKKFRDATEYKGGDRLKNFLERKKSGHES